MEHFHWFTPPATSLGELELKYGCFYWRWYRCRLCILRLIYKQSAGMVSYLFPLLGKKVIGRVCQSLPSKLTVTAAWPLVCDLSKPHTPFRSSKTAVGNHSHKLYLKAPARMNSVLHLYICSNFLLSIPLIWRSIISLSPHCSWHYRC